MINKINTANEFLKANILKIIIALFAVLGFYLDNTYVSTSAHSKVQRELDTLKVKFRLYTNQQELEHVNRTAEFKTLQRRFETKIKLINKNTDKINENEKDIIRLQK